MFFDDDSIFYHIIEFKTICLGYHYYFDIIYLLLAYFNSGDVFYNFLDVNLFKII